MALPLEISIFVQSTVYNNLIADLPVFVAT